MVRYLCRNTFIYVWSLFYTWYRYRFAEVTVPELLFRNLVIVRHLHITDVWGVAVPELLFHRLVRGSLD